MQYEYLPQDLRRGMLEAQDRLEMSFYEGSGKFSPFFNT